MIRYTLVCDGGHDFEGWFSASADFDRQKELGFLACPTCGSTAVSKQLMAPSVATARRKEERQTLMMDQAKKETVAKIREVVAAIRASSEDVGTRFPDEARKIHYGEVEQRGIIGQAKPEEARALLDEGIEIAPLPVFPDDTN